MAKENLMHCILLICFCALTGCGIEYLATLEEPIFGETSDIDDYFIVYTDSTVPSGIHNELEFRGVEFYYKFYNQSTSPESEIDSIDDLSQAEGFFRIASELLDAPSRDDRPLGKIYSHPVDNRDYESRFTLNFSAQGAEYLAIKDITHDRDVSDYDTFTVVFDNNYRIRRGVQNGALDEYKTFPDIDSADSDLKHLDPAVVTAGDLRLALYAVTFGIDSNFLEVYSPPLYMLYIDVSY